MVVYWDPATPGPVRVGFIVSKAVGGAVTRNRVRRQLRHVVRELLGPAPAAGVPRLSSGTLVVRVLPPAAGASSAALAAELSGCVRRATAGSAA